MKNVLIKILDLRAKVPTKAYASAGFDLYPLEDHFIPVGGQIKIPLGFATEFPSEYVAIIDDRGSTGNSGLCHMAGVIDSDYRGEWIIIIRNMGDSPYHCVADKAIAQVLFHTVENPIWRTTDTLSETGRGANKLGSSNKC